MSMRLCGALSGAVMAAGLLADPGTTDDPREPSVNAAAEVLQRFENEYGSAQCADVIHPFGDFSGPGRHEHCRAIVGRCADWVHEIAEREGWL
jgi:C_GCAxxG_C_C family probable redox protein